jgi:hypothetical protein
MVRVQILGVCIFGVGVLVALGPASHGEGRVTQAAAACTSIAAPSRRLELADGRIVSIDVQSVARAGEFVLAVGRYAYLFPPNANSRTSPELVDSILGVLIDGGGRVTLVANPAAPRTVRYARVAAMPNGDFSVLYATSAPEGLLAHTDTATLWLATFRGRAWSSTSRVAVVRSATLDGASALLQRDGQLAFVFSFRDDRGYSDDGGAVLLRQRQGRWMSDTLRTETEPTSVSATYDSVGGSIVVALAVADHRPPLLAQRLLIARFDSSWSRPVAIAGDGVVPIAHPSLVANGIGLVASWLTWPKYDPTRGWLQWLQLDATGRAHLRSVIDSGRATFPFELTVVNSAPLWLYHGVPFGEAVKLMMANDSSVTRLPDVKAEFWNPATKTIALSGSRLLVFTQRRALTGTEPMAASFTTALEIRCPRSGQP